MDILKNVSSKAEDNAKNYLKIAPMYVLGETPTEIPNPVTTGLSDMSINDLPKGINVIKSLDIHAIEVLKEKITPYISNFYKDIKRVLDTNGRIFICGCGSSGRLSIVLETLFRIECNINNLKEKVISFMSGGDAATIKAIEDFEDHPEFAKQQLFELGFSENDLLIACTEGGEAFWVTGAVEYVSEKYGTQFKNKPYFVYCNPDDILCKKVERSRKVIENPDIQKLNLYVGPMALTGSTRMQASTIMTYAIGLPLLFYLKYNQKENEFVSYANKHVDYFLDTLKSIDIVKILQPLTVEESQIYQNNGYVYYMTTPYFAMSVLTDTTERSPTFSLYPFENEYDSQKVASLCHLIFSDNLLKGKTNPWELIFCRNYVRALDSQYFQKYQDKASTKRMLGHDFSMNLIEKRKQYVNSSSSHNIFQINPTDKGFEFRIHPDIQGKEIHTLMEFKEKPDILLSNLFLKILLNNHSTLVAGRLGRYQSNLMIFVRASNNKLIDRAIRFVSYLINQNKQSIDLKKPGQADKIDYNIICRALFSELESHKYDEAVVLKTYDRILRDILS